MNYLPHRFAEIISYPFPVAAEGSGITFKAAGIIGKIIHECLSAYIESRGKALEERSNTVKFGFCVRSFHI